MQTTSQNPDSRSKASPDADRCPFCAPTLERGSKCCAATVNGYGCTRLPGHEGPCVACGDRQHCIAVSDEEGSA